MSDAWLVLAGPTRTGTTSLFRHLATSPALCPSLRKETNYFLDCLRAGKAADAGEYRQLFCTGDGRRMEASPLYFAIGRPLANQLNALPGDLKVLLTLREPVARFRSLLMHVQTKRNVDAPPAAAEFVAAALAAADRSAGIDDENLLAFREGCYRELVEEWLQVLGSERVRVVFFESLEQSPERVLPELHAWLGIPPALQPPPVLPRENAAREVKWRRLHRYSLLVNSRLEPLLNRARPLRALLRTLYYRLNGRANRDPLSPALVARLEDAYAQRNAGLAGYIAPLTLGPLPAWVPR